MTQEFQVDIDSLESEAAAIESSGAELSLGVSVDVGNNKSTAVDNFTKAGAAANLNMTDLISEIVALSGDLRTTVGLALNADEAAQKLFGGK